MTPQNRGAEPPTDALFARCRIENPERLARGALDLGFVALVIAPLLLIGLGYGVFAAIAKTERRLWPAQTGTPLRLIAVRSGNRLALVPVECGRCWCSWRRSRSAAALINPPPSRFEGIAAVRVAEVAATRSYEDDHPELVFATVEGRREWLRKGNEVRQSVARAAAPCRPRRKSSSPRNAASGSGCPCSRHRCWRAIRRPAARAPTPPPTRCSGKP